MRLWSLHPRYFDGAGLVAVWREGLLARAVLRGATRGYTRHPQLERFRACRRPLAVLDTYLDAICDEAERRGYRFDRGKLGRARTRGTVSVTRGQVRFEWRHLRGKLRRRAAAHWTAVCAGRRPAVHPVFRVVPGPRASWERGARRAATCRSAG
jgi:hypothetical protein